MLFSKVFFYQILQAHIMSCIWFFIGNNSNVGKNSTSWLTTTGLLHSHWYLQYLSSYYFCIVTTVTGINNCFFQKKNLLFIH